VSSFPVGPRDERAWLKAQFHRILSGKSETAIAHLPADHVVGLYAKSMTLPPSIDTHDAREIAGVALREQADYRGVERARDDDRDATADADADAGTDETEGVGRDP